MNDKLKDKKQGFRLNFFDIALILIVIAAAVFVWWQFSGKDKVEQSLKIVYTIEFKGMQDEPYEQIDITGQEIIEGVLNRNLGKIVGFTSVPYIEEKFDQIEGKVFFAEIANRLTYYMEIEAEAVVKNKGRLHIYVNGTNDYMIAYGLEISVKTDGFYGRGVIAAIREIGE